MVIAIIGILIGVLLPVLAKARRASVRVSCASNLRQIATAFTNYLNDTRGVVFWRSVNINTEGMDWYVYGGQEQGNTNSGQGGLFNKYVPRPLNPYVKGNLSVFHCPSDEPETSPWAAGASHFASLVTDMAGALEEMEGPVFAYCRSGTRCTNLYMAIQQSKG